MAKHTDLSTLTRPSSPNTYLLAPDGLCQNAKPDAAAPVFNTDPDTLYKTALAHIADQRNWMVDSRDPALRQVDIVAATKILKFRDDVTIRVLEDQNDGHKSQLAVYSRSRVGYSDLGANRKRTEKLVEALKEKVGKTA